MKYFFFFLFISFFASVDAQEKLVPIRIKANEYKTVFNIKVNTNDINPSLKKSDNFYKMSSSLIYCSQPKFDLAQNLRIPLLDGKIVLAKYSSTSILKVGSVSYVYKIVNDKEGLIVFTEYKNYLVGSIMLGNGERFYISQFSDNIFYFLIRKRHQYF